MSSHTGAHIDAPYHFFREGKRINEFLLETRDFCDPRVFTQVKEANQRIHHEDDIVNFETKARIGLG